VGLILGLGWSYSILPATRLKAVRGSPLTLGDLVREDGLLWL
jgi:hypothetical protein